MAKTITVLGASGNVGWKLAARLLEKGARVRAVARDAGRLAGLAAKGAEVLAGDAGDAAFLGKAFRGADAAFALLPPKYDAVDDRAEQGATGEAQAKAIRESGIPFVVFLSSLGAHLPERTGPILGLHDQESRLRALSGVAVHALRPTYFMENHLFGIGLVKAQGIYGSPIRADVAMPQIATADIAERAAERLLGPAPAGFVTEELLGPADLTMPAAARALGASIGRPDLPYVVFPYEAAGQAMLSQGMSASVAGAMIEMNRGFNDGWIVPEKPRDAAATTPTTIEAFAKAVFAPAFCA